MTWLTLCSMLVRPFEGCARMLAGLVHPYLDRLAKPNVWTRGYGRTYGISATSPAITPAEAITELDAGLQNYAAKVVALAPGLAARPACLAAVVSWSWNCGIGAFKASRLRRAINEGRWADAGQLIRKPNTAGGVIVRGLDRRRVAEASLFATGIR